MKALVKFAPGPGNVDILDVDEPVCGPSQVKVEVAFCGLCGTDIHVLQDTFRNYPPVILGHEFSGTVVEVGSQVTGASVGETITKGFQLWVALPEKLELAPSESHYLSAEQVPLADPARVILGKHNGVLSSISAPEGINYLDVELKAGERWTYRPPSGHDVLWLALSQGVVHANELVTAGELVIFEESDVALQIQAKSAARFVLGSAIKHPHALVTGYYSVHTSPAALHAGESEIRRIGSQWAAARVIR